MDKVFCSTCVFAKYAEHTCHCNSPIRKRCDDTYWAAGKEYLVYEDIRMKNKFNDCPDYQGKIGEDDE